MRSSFLPKCQPKIARISALPCNKLPEPKVALGKDPLYFTSEVMLTLLNPSGHLGHTLITLAYKGTYLVRKSQQNVNLVNRLYLIKST